MKRRLLLLFSLTFTAWACAGRAQTLPAGWTGGGVGSPGSAGSASVSNGTWTVSGGGTEIWGTSDQFHFVSRVLRGDGAVVARVASVGNTNGWAKSGVMLRADATAGAVFADVVVTPSNSVVFQWRNAAGASAQSVAAVGTVPAPVWVRLTRGGGAVSGSFSCDGVNWVQLGEPQPVALGASALAGLAVCAVNNAALSTSTFTAVGVVPAGWSDADIGAPSLAGAAAFDGSALTVAGSGEVFGTSDQFHFTSQSLVGDGVVVAKVASLVGGGAYAKAGVMIRDGAAANASYAFSFLTPSTGAGGQGANFEYRNGAGSAAQSAASAAGVTAPGWVKLVRRGNAFTAFRSGDGATWTQNGPAVSIAMGATVQAGIAVSGGGAQFATAAFSGVSVLSADWEDSDFGTPALAGSARFDGLSWRVNGGGADVWGASDQFHFARRTWSGDVTLIAKVRSLSNTANFAKAGLMIRDGTGADASYAFAFFTPNNPQPYAGALLEARAGAGTTATSHGSTAGVFAPAWLKLVRSGNVFTASRSADGVTWTQFGSVTVGMNATVQAGLAVCANDNAALASAQFSDVFVGATPRDSFLKTSGTAFKNQRGTGDTVHLRGANLGAWMLHEGWMSSMDSSGLADDITVRDTLRTRFGRALSNRIIAAFEDHWITETDLDNCRALGLNVLRVPFSYRCVMDSDFNWRSDAFTQLDWIVDEAWKRGIYTILDLHGAPGGASPYASSGQVNGGALWTDAALQTHAVTLWTNVAAHFAGHPGIAAYDLLNEPVPPSHAAMWSLYDRMYDAIRAVDAEHIVMMEGGGGAGVNNSYWSVDSLPAPSSQGWTNVAYQSHAYALDGGTGAEGTAQWQVTQLGMRGVPLLVGEFNLGDHDNYGVQLWDDHGLNWTKWSFKVSHAMSSNWGIYEVTNWPWSPNLQTETASNILAAYDTIATPGHFGLNTAMRDIVGTPQLADDSYTTTPNQSLYVAPALGVLANDTIPNAGQSGITAHAYRVDGPSNGTLTLYEDGSFSYTPAAEFAGTDTFRYFVWDNHNDSANLATVSISVRPSALPAGWTATDIAAARTGWSSYDSAAATWTLAGSGADIWNAGDEFQFATRTFVGDAEIIARVGSIENTDPWAKAGVMLRDSMSAAAPYAAVVVTPGNGIAFHYRTAAGASATGAAPASGTAPRWVKLVRTGDTLRAFHSSNGSAWTQLGTAQTIAMSATARAGLAVTAHNTAALNTSTFTNVSATTLAPFQSWQYQHFTAAQLADPLTSGPAADANGDGMKNLLAYAFNASPWSNLTPSLPTAQLTGGYLTTTFIRRKAPTDLAYTIEVSANLTSWSTATTVTNTTSIDTATELITIRDNVPSSGETKRFIRVRVQQ